MNLPDKLLECPSKVIVGGFLSRYINESGIHDWGVAARETLFAPAPRQDHKMPRYFFNVQDGRNINDDTGMELPDIYAAQHEAIKLSGELLREMGGDFWNETEWILRVCENNAVLFVLRFSAEERNVVSR